MHAVVLVSMAVLGNLGQGEGSMRCRVHTRQHISQSLDCYSKADSQGTDAVASCGFLSKP